VRPLTNAEKRRLAAFIARRSVQDGRAEARRVLSMTAAVAVQHNPTLRAFHDRMRRAGKAPKVALAADMQKLLIADAIVRSGAPRSLPIVAACPRSASAFETRLTRR
jgi:transposase